MATATLTIDLDAIAANWRALDRASDRAVATGAVVKANGYGLEAGRVARTLARAGARQFFVAVAEEGVAVREALGPGPAINVFSGHMAGDTQAIAGARLTPMLNSADQLARHLEALPGHPFGIQLDTGMNRLGMEADEWAAVAEFALSQSPRVVMSHLACADEPGHPANAAQLAEFHRLTDGISVPRSLSATGGILLGSAYHFDLTRPGIGLYGGAPFGGAEPVVRLSIPVVQVRAVSQGESVGYGCSWVAQQEGAIATLSAGYADGLIRAMSNRAMLYAGDVACPLAGRVSMDLLTVDVSHLAEVPDTLDLLCPAQGVDRLADAAGTIGYEILTSLGDRYARLYAGDAG
ncbi:MAG: alanine racemase [Pseudomonadota bacterium]